jgi:hypothetical protein
MAELSPADVAQYTSGRLSPDDPNTAQMLAAALAAARRSVGWFVSPVALGDVITLDNPHATGSYWWSGGYGGGRKLRLPTQKIVNLTSVVDNGNTLDLTPMTGDVFTSAQVPWLLTRRHGCWSSLPGAQTVITLDHGFTEDEAVDWRQAILGLVDQMSTVAMIGRPDSELASKQVDDVTYKWNPTPMLPAIEPILARYRLLWGWV